LTGDKPVPSPNNIGQRAYIKNDLAWSVLSAVAVTILLSSRLGTTWFAHSGRGTVLATLAAVGAFLFAVGWIAGRPVRRSWQDFAPWTASGLVYGALVGLGAYLFSVLHRYLVTAPPSEATTQLSDLILSLPIMFGIPWVLTSQLAAEKLFIGLVSYEPDSDSDREWLGRASGFAIAVAIGWAVTAFLSIAVGNCIIHEIYPYLGAYVATLGGMSGIATTLIGKSSKIAAKTNDNEGSRTGFILNLVLAVAGPVFAAALIVGISIALDLLLIGDSLLHAQHRAYAN